MNATVTKAASRSSHGANGQMAHAIAKASKEHAEREAVKKAEEMADNVIKAASTPAKLYSVGDIASTLSLSTSWVYQQVLKDKPVVVATVGKRHFYANEYLESLKSKGAKPRMRRVTPIQRASKQTSVTAPRVVEHVVQHTTTLLERLTQIETEQANIEKMLERITDFLGLKL